MWRDQKGGMEFPTCSGSDLFGVSILSAESFECHMPWSQVTAMNAHVDEKSTEEGPA